MRRFVGVFLPIAVIAGVVAISALLSDRGSEAAVQESGAAPKSTFTLDAAKAFSDWPLYSVGPTFQGMPMRALLRHHVTKPYDPEMTRIRPNYVSFIYGDCVATSDAGCAPPLEIQISPSCSYTPADIEIAQAGDVMVRGVKGTFYEDRTKLTIVAGRSTISIYGLSAADVVEVANKLEGVNVPLERSENLPPPEVSTTRC